MIKDTDLQYKRTLGNYPDSILDECVFSVRAISYGHNHRYKQELKEEIFNKVYGEVSKDIFKFRGELQLLLPSLRDINEEQARALITKLDKIIDKMKDK